MICFGLGQIGYAGVEFWGVTPARKSMMKVMGERTPVKAHKVRS